jgi:hypothetical protein
MAELLDRDRRPDATCRCQAELDRRFKPFAFIDNHRGAHGVEPICKVLPIVPSTYHAHMAQQSEPARALDRVRRDTVLSVEIRRMFEANSASMACVRCGGSSSARASRRRAAPWRG